MGKQPVDTKGDLRRWFEAEGRKHNLGNSGANAW